MSLTAHLPTRRKFEIMTKMPLHVVYGDDGMEAYVWDAPNGGYNVTLRDADADEFLPMAAHVEDIDRAVDIAKAWAPKGP